MTKPKPPPPQFAEVATAADNDVRGLSGEWMKRRRLARTLMLSVGVGDVVKGSSRKADDLAMVVLRIDNPGVLKVDARTLDGATFSFTPETMASGRVGFSIKRKMPHPTFDTKDEELAQTMVGFFCAHKAYTGVPPGRSELSDSVSASRLLLQRHRDLVLESRHENPRWLLGDMGFDIQRAHQGINTFRLRAIPHADLLFRLSRSV